MVQHGAAIVQRLEHGDADVRRAAVDALGTSPEAVIVMGTFAARAMLGEDATVPGARGRWATLKWEGGSAKARVTHHPEGILALAARGESGAKREAFEDLKAVAQLLS